MPIRNPFARRPPGAVVAVPDENAPPDRDSRDLGFERVDTVGFKASSALSMRSAITQDTGEYKMSVVNDSGVYLPPSPVEERAPWPRKYLLSRASSSDAGSNSGDIEPFSISRESFDSYRRSFDITARSPVISHDMPMRQSLDSARLQRVPRSVPDRRKGPQPPTPEERFEDIGLDDNKPQQPRKRGFFSKFGEPSELTGQPGVPRFLMHGRKRRQSVQGSELDQMERTETCGKTRS